MSTLPILDKKGKQTDKLQLPEKMFGERVNREVLHQAIIKYRASLRQGNASTKERAYVSGGGAKPFRQKGTGRARAGSSRSPLWQGGGVTFGPHPRDFSYSIPKKVRKLALKESLNAKIQSKELICIEEIKDKFSKTKEFAAILKSLSLSGKILALLDGYDDSVKLVTRNIPRFSIMRTEDVNAYDIMKNKNLLITKTALGKLIKRLET